MPLAPIRGAPPGAPNPDFPVEEPKLKSPPTTAASSHVEQPQEAAKRQRGAPIEIRGEGSILTFRVIPELPAISRASMTVHVMAGEPGSTSSLGFLKMSAAKVGEFLADLRDGRSPIVARGDEDGTVQITFEVTDAGAMFSVRGTTEPGILCRCVIDPSIDVRSVADELLGDLGT